MRTLKYAAGLIPMVATVIGVSLSVATPASAGSVRPAPATAAVVAQYDLPAASPMVWYIYNFYPDEGTCEAQRRWGASQGYWRWQDSACATNGNEWALFIQFDGVAAD